MVCLLETAYNWFFTSLRTAFNLFTIASSSWIRAFLLSTVSVACSSSSFVSWYRPTHSSYMPFSALYFSPTVWYSSCRYRTVVCNCSFFSTASWYFCCCLRLSDAVSSRSMDSCSTRESLSSFNCV